MPRPVPDPLVNLLHRPVAILGAGVSGQGVLALLATISAQGELYDERAENVRRGFSALDAKTHSLVVYSPGFAPEHPWLVTARGAGCTCLGELDFASLFWPGELIAVTGTNGKTSLTEFLAHALNLAGRRAMATGNVGYSFSRFVVEQTGKMDVAVCEVSSFQAETLQHLRPTATLWTNFAEDHLERHASLPAYFAAKHRLLERTPEERRLVGTSVASYAKGAGVALTQSQTVATENQPIDPSLGDSLFATYPQRENFLLAAAWWRLAGLAEAQLYAAAKTYQSGHHRLSRVGEKRGVTFWNDSKATNFHAVEAALATFSGPVLWIGGGKSKGGDLGSFILRIATKVHHAFLIGETQSALLGHCAAVGVPASACVGLGEAVNRAFAMATEGDHVLLSPGFASFDMFRGYDDRGRQFESLVGNL